MVRQLEVPFLLGARTTSHPRHQGQSLIIWYERVVQLVTEWETKMIKLRDKLQTVSDVVKSRYLSQMKLDTKDIILRYHGLGNQAKPDKLYNFVTEKCDCQFWFMAVYDDMGGFDKHNMWQHGGTCYLHEHDKNIIISSQSKNHASRFNKNNADKLLEKVENTVL